MSTDYQETLKTSGISEGGISYYCMTKSDITSGKYFPQLSAVMNAYFNPYLKFENLTTEVEDISDNIQTAGGANGEGWMGSVKRITSHNALNDKITDFEVVDKTGLTIGGKWNWRNESKCHCAPFTLLSYEDGLSEPLTIYPQYCNPGTNSIMVRAALNQMGYYLMYVEGYRGDESGLTYGVVSQASPIPTVTNAYSDYMTINREKIMTERLISGGQVLVGAGVSIATGNVLGLGQAMYSGMSLAQSLLNERALKGQANTVNATNSQYAFSLQQNKYGQLYKYQYKEDVMERIGWHFHLFGYKQNKIMIPNLKSRRRFNYLKTIQANLNTSGIPKQFAQKLSEIFDNGVTVWHVDNGITIKDYSMDNEEV